MGMSKAIMSVSAAVFCVLGATGQAVASGFDYELEPPAILEEGGNGARSQGRRVPSITDDLVLSGLGWGTALGAAGLVGGGVAALNCSGPTCLAALFVYPAVGFAAGYMIGVPLGVGLGGPRNASTHATVAGFGGALAGAAVGISAGVLTGALLTGAGDPSAGFGVGGLVGVVATGIAVPAFSVMFYEWAYDAQFDVAVVPTFQEGGGGLAAYGRF